MLVDLGEVLRAVVRVLDVVEDDARRRVRGRRLDEVGKVLVQRGTECEAVERVGGGEAPGMRGGRGVVETGDGGELSACT